MEINPGPKNQSSNTTAGQSSKDKGKEQIKNHRSTQTEKTLTIQKPHSMGRMGKEGILEGHHQGLTEADVDRSNERRKSEGETKP